MTDKKVAVEKIDDVRQKLISGIKLLIWMCVIIAVLLVGSLIRAQQLGNQLERSDDLLTETKEIALHTEEAAEATLEEFRTLVRRAEENAKAEPDLNNQAIIDALIAISRIENFLCDGVCSSDE